MKRMLNSDPAERIRAAEVPDSCPSPLFFLSAARRWASVTAEDRALSLTHVRCSVASLDSLRCSCIHGLPRTFTSQMANKASRGALRQTL
jgi:hypothetical protein